MPDYTLIIGLEVHSQLKTQSKLFCGCPNRFNPDEPNTQTCPVCLGLPGSLPVMNQEAFDLSIRTGLALNCTIPTYTKWDRKQYYYPDLPKAYQISQFDLPCTTNGWMDIPSSDEAGEDGATKRIRIIRAHLEEDAGKSIHDESGRGGDTCVDLNRTGTPLLEIVSEPDLRSATDARKYLEELRTLLLFMEVSDCNMQEGSLRCDANVNLHVHNEDGSTTATPIAELKNMNSFRNVELAIAYEEKRQWREFKKTGLTIEDAFKTTRGWDADAGRSFEQREKEESADYRYFPDPDLVAVRLTEDEIESVRSSLPLTPAVRRERFEKQLKLSGYDASVIIDQGPEFTSFFDDVVSICDDAKLAANWTTQEVLRDLNASECSLSEFPITAAFLGQLLKKIADRTITNKSAREIYALLKAKAGEGDSITAEVIEQLADERQIVTDSSALDAAIASAMNARPDAIEDVKAGKLQAAGPLIGMVMKQVSGADPKTVRDMLIKTIQES